MMISCQEVVTELWDYLDGELPVERAAAVADHLAECARCYPHYRFEYAFLAAVARQRAQGPGPSAALVEKVAGAVLANKAGARGHLGQRARGGGAVDERRPTPRAAAPLRPRGPSLGLRARTERWALVILRASLGVFLLLSSVGKLLAPVPPSAISPQVWAAAAGFEACLAAVILLGLWRRWTYGVTLGVHVASVLVFWNAVRDPWEVVLAGLPTCGALIALYLLRDRDPWTLDAWLAWRRPWRVVR